MNDKKIEQIIDVLRRYSDLYDVIDIRKDNETLKALDKECETLINIIGILENAYTLDKIAKEEEYKRLKEECPDLGMILDGLEDK